MAATLAEETSRRVAAAPAAPAPAPAPAQVAAPAAPAPAAAAAAPAPAQVAPEALASCFSLSVAWAQDASQ